MLSDAATRIFAWCVLAVSASALVAWIVHVFHQTHYTAAQFPIFMFNLFMTRVLWRARLSGPLPIPEDQGTVIVCNHIGPIDPGFIAATCNRPLHWMVAREYCEHPAVGWAFRVLRVIPTGRSGIDTAATKMAIRYAQGGGLVGVFPEGRLNTTGRLLLPGRPGAAWIALKAQVPVVPCYIVGSPNDGTPFGFLLMTAKTTLQIGRPIDISQFYGREGEKEVLEELTKRFLVEIAGLAGVHDFVPELAGRRWKPGAEED